MRLQTTTYEIKSGKVSSPVRIAFVSDLHNSLFGKNQSELKNAIDGAKPDIVVFGGDLADKTQDDLPENSYILVISRKALSVLLHYRKPRKCEGRQRKDKTADVGLRSYRA